MGLSQPRRSHFTVLDVCNSAAEPSQVGLLFLVVLLDPPVLQGFCSRESIYGVLLDEGHDQIFSLIRNVVVAGTVKQLCNELLSIQNIMHDLFLGHLVVLYVLHFFLRHPHFLGLVSLAKQIVAVVRTLTVLSFKGQVALQHHVKNKASGPKVGSLSVAGVVALESFRRRIDHCACLLFLHHNGSFVIEFRVLGVTLIWGLRTPKCNVIISQYHL